MAKREGQIHHFYCYQGLPVSLQILLPCGQEFQGEDVLGGGKASH